jgi:hypothetical protein
MKKLLMAVAVMCSFAMAQTGGTSTDTKTEHSEHKAHAKHEAAAGGEKTMTGCLHKDGDNIWFKSKSGNYHVMSNDDLSAHDGHEVKISGKTSMGPLGDKKNVKHLEASNVEMVSETCTMGKMAKSDKANKEAPKQ